VDVCSGFYGSAPAGYQQVAAIEQWLRGEVRYVRGPSDAKTSAVDTAHSKTGVCRDYAHLGISLTRSLNIPARMVVGYFTSLNPWTFTPGSKPFIGGRWFTFDGTQKSPRGNRVIGYGRDAADVALTSNYGALELNAMKVTIEIASE
jgi:transglutaminase-like putative cysteine protease